MCPRNGLQIPTAEEPQLCVLPTFRFISAPNCFPVTLPIRDFLVDSFGEKKGEKIIIKHEHYQLLLKILKNNYKLPFFNILTCIIQNESFILNFYRMIHLFVIKLYNFCGIVIIFSINTDLHTW